MPLNPPPPKKKNDNINKKYRYCINIFKPYRITATLFKLYSILSPKDFPIEYVAFQSTR